MIYNLIFCQTTNIIYNAQITSTNNEISPKLYIGLTESIFKQRYNNHTNSFRHKKYETSTELSKHIWEHKDRNEAYEVKWSISNQAAAYTNETKRCNLCLTEKLCISKADKTHLLNKRSELISKCRHENKYYLINFKIDPT